jgi:ferric-dicitrate binding protein FerR (iron transport regulator)
MSHENDDYLWDRSGDPDPAVVRLEEILGTLRSNQDAPTLPAKERSRRVYSFGRLSALAAGLVLISAAAIWLLTAFRGSAWDVTHVAGVPAIDGRAIADTARLSVGARLVTDATSRARLLVGYIGQVDVDPDTRLQLVEARTTEHRLSLERGTIHARIWAPPRLFFVNTPAATAIDLGCAYTLHVDDDGNGLLRVSSGWVQFERDGRESYVPQGAMCETRPRVGPGTPRYEDAPSGYGPALSLLDFGDPRLDERAAALSLIVEQARRRDALTLWHLLSRGTDDERARVFDRLAALVPPPPGVSRELVLARDRGALGRWWNVLGVQTGGWWKLKNKL